MSPPPAGRRRSSTSLILGLALAASAFLALRVTAPTEPGPPVGARPGAEPVPRAESPPPPEFAGASALLDAERLRRSDLLVEVDGRVGRILRDDREGSPHQRFLIRVADSVTVLVAHNLDLAERVPVASGDRVTVRGEYEWNAKGGVLHWTHDDPARRHPDGFIRHRNRIYQ